MKSYKELEVWQQAVELTVAMYRATAKFPAEEKFGLVSQLRRAASSVPANIAEGWGRGSTKEYIQFLLIARGSLMEVETHLIIAARLDYLDRPRLDQLQSDIQRIGMMLNGLIQSLRNRTP
ncbi:MAG: four helix bundle protein [Verrucomicrobiota bacterium]